MTNPLASPQPVVGIHFEVIIGEGLMVTPLPPPLVLQITSVSRISIKGDQHTRTNTQATMSPDLAKFTQLWLQEQKFTGWLSAQNWKYVEEEE